MKKALFIIYYSLFIALFAVLPQTASAAWSIVDSLDLSHFIPIVLDAFMSVAMAGYDFFVGNGAGIIYLFVWGWLGWTIAMYLVKMYFPANWLGFFGMSGGSQMWDGKASGMSIGTDLLKPAIRGIIAAALLLPIKPQYITQFAVEPFLRFGALYTTSISENISQMNLSAGAKQIECPAEITEKGYISAESCKFLVQPVADISHANNQIIKRGLQFITSGLAGLMTLFPHGGRDIMNLITGIFLVFAFVASNFFMALLIIQGIFEFGMALILYPFKVLVFVAKDSKQWINPWPAFDSLIEKLKKLVITMIACVFILAVNIAAIRALFNFNNSVFVVAAGGTAQSNVPVVANQAMGFGQHSVLWLSALLTFFLMFKIFELTKERLITYTGKDMTGLYDKATKDAKSTYKGISNWGKGIGKAMGWIKK
jgi:hypothetical protein